MKALFLLLLGVLRGGHEYKIVLADRLWMSEGQALRYIDHLKMLSSKLSNVSGAVTTTYKLNVDREWDIVFDLAVSGDFNPKSDSYGFALTKNLLTEEDWATLRENPSGSIASSAGLYAFVARDQLSFAVREGAKAGGTAPKSCPKLFSPLHLRLHARDGQIKLFLSDAQSNVAPLTECGRVEFAKGPFKSFYLSFWARSRSNPWQLDVKNVLFESDAENSTIETYFSQLDHSLPRLFRTINLLSSHPAALPPSPPPTALNVSQLYQLEEACFAKFDVVNSLLEANLEQSDELVSYLQSQRQSVSEMSESIMSSLSHWIDDTSEQYALMARDADEITGQLSAYDFHAAYQKTRRLIDELEGQLSAKSGLLRGLNSLGVAYKQNFALLSLARKTLRKTPKLLRSLRYRLAHKKEKGQSIALLSALSVVGAVVLGFLLSILRRLKRAQQKKLFE